VLYRERKREREKERERERKRERERERKTRLNRVDYIELITIFLFIYHIICLYIILYVYDFDICFYKIIFYYDIIDIIYYRYGRNSKILFKLS